MKARYLMTLCVLTLGLVRPAGAAENVVEQWRSPFGAPASVSVRASDGSVWAATGSSVMHLAADGAVLSQTDGFWGPEGVAVHQTDGTCWVADGRNHQVVHLAEDGSVIWRGGVNLVRPKAVAVNSGDGSCWVADQNGGQVVHLKADGSELWRGTSFTSPRSVSVDTGDYSCWVANTVAGEVVHLDRYGNEMQRVPGFANPLSVSASTSDGHSCWVADSNNNQVVKLSSTGGELKRLSGFWYPTSVSTNSADKSVWVGDKSNGEVVHLDKDGNELWRGSAFSTISLSVDPTDGSCTVADDGAAQIIRLKVNGDEQWREGAFLLPSALAVDTNDGTCWVADTGNGEIVHLNRDGDELWRGGDIAAEAIAVNPKDHTVWAPDSGGTEVVHLSAAGVEFVPRAGGFSLPGSISVSLKDNSVWVADNGHGQVVHLAANGSEIWRSSAGPSPRYVAATSTGGCWVGGGAQAVLLSGAGVTAAASPVFPQTGSVAVNPTDGSVWVAILNGLGGPTDEVAHLDSTGKLLWRGGEYCGMADMSVDPVDGSVWLTDLNCDQVVHLDKDGNELSRRGGFRQPDSVSVDPSDGSCWVADYRTSQVVLLKLDRPAAGFDATTTSGPAPLEVGFTDTSVGNPTLWLWEFGDGGTSAEQSPKHLYQADGVYTVSLTVTNEFGSDTETKVGFITVSTPLPKADFYATPATGPAPLEVQFTDLSTGNPQTYLWSFGDGGTAATRNPKHTYTAGGQYTVSLTVTNAKGSNTATKTAYILALIPPPSADFLGTPTAGLAPLMVVFEDQSTGNPTSWLWSADGMTSSQETAAFTFTKPGTKTVSLTASNAGGTNTATKEKYILVSFPDVPLDHWAMEEVVSCVDAGVVVGYGDGSYRPDEVVTRDQMAVYISRAVAGGDANVPKEAGEPFFTDVLKDHWAYAYIQYAKTRGIVQGVTPTTYEPDIELDRAQMAAFIARAIATPMGEAGLVTYTPAAADTFPDVDSNQWAYKYIGYVKNQGVAHGYDDGTYRPGTPCTRDQMAVFVTRAFKLPL